MSTNKCILPLIQHVICDELCKKSHFPGQPIPQREIRQLLEIYLCLVIQSGRIGCSTIFHWKISLRTAAGSFHLVCIRVTRVRAEGFGRSSPQCQRTASSLIDGSSPLQKRPSSLVRMETRSRRIMLNQVSTIENDLKRTSPYWDFHLPNLQHSNKRVYRFDRVGVCWSPLNPNYVNGLMEVDFVHFLTSQVRPSSFASMAVPH